MKKLITVFIFALVCIEAEQIHAQELDKIVFVESTFKPQVETAEKFSTVPLLNDTVSFKPNIKYNVLPSHVETSYKIKSIKPATLVGSKLDELYKSQIKLGIGNYFTPLAEFSIHNLRSKEYAVGAYLFHKSSHTNLELENGMDIPSGYSQNRAKLYGKRFYNNLNVEGELFFNTDKYRYYGLNTSIVPDSLDIKPRDIRQYYTFIGAKAYLYSTYADSNEFQYNIGLDLSNLTDDYDNKQFEFTLPVDLDFNIKSFRVKAITEYSINSTSFDTLNSARHYFQFRPSLNKSAKEWNVRLGFNSFVIRGDTSDLFLFPEALLSFNVVEGVMEAFFGITSDNKLNSMRELTQENQYIRPGTSVYNTRTFTGYGGLKGQLGSNSGYETELSFNTVKNAYFWVNDTSNFFENYFIEETDNLELIQWKGSVWYRPYTFLQLMAKASYSSYSRNEGDYAWHVPDYKFNMVASYNFKQKVFADLDIIFLGKRYAKNLRDLNNPFELDPVIDINLQVEYKYSNVLSAFVSASNILSKQYYIWNQYPTQKINLMVGFSYKF